MALTFRGRLPRQVGSLPGQMIKRGNATYAAADTTTDKAVIAAPTTGNYLHITSIIVAANGTTAAAAFLLNIKSGTNILFSLPYIATATTERLVLQFMDQGGIRLNQNEAFNIASSATLTGAGDFRIFANGYEDSD